MSRPRTKVLPRIVAAWGVALFLILVGTTASQAYWTTGNQTVTTTGTGGSVEATQSGFSALNGNLTRYSRVRSTTITFTNTGILDSDWSYSLTSSSPSVAQTTFWLWPQAPGQNCATATPTGGTTATGSMPAALTGHFDPRATVSLCARVSVSSSGMRTYGGAVLALGGNLVTSLGNWTGGGTENSTVSLGDEDPPSTPTLTVDRLSGFSARITWPASTDNVAVAGYKVYRGSTLVATLGADVLTYTDTGLNANTAYGFSVRAFDAVGNTSSSSTTTVRTLSIVSGQIYSLFASYANKCVDVARVESAIGTELHTWDCANSANQRFAFRPQPDGTYILEPQHATNTAIGVEDGNDGTWVRLRAKTDWGVRWIAEPSRDGFALRNADSGKYLDIEGGWTGNDIHVIQWYSTGGTNQAYVLR